MHERLTYVINGGLFAVQNQMGSIWPEEAYEAALELELRKRKLHVERQKEFDVLFRQTVRNVPDRSAGERSRYRRTESCSGITAHPPRPITLLSQRLPQTPRRLNQLRRRVGRTRNHAQRPAERPPLTDRFDYDALTLPGKARIKDLLSMANRVLVTLGPGYLPQIYRRAMFYELQTARAEFETIKRWPRTTIINPSASRT